MGISDTEGGSNTITYRFVVGKAWPIILANAAAPLLGLVDTAVIGNLGSTQDLGAIALGALIFTFVYWGFGFLRMSTTAFTAQAVGAGNEEEVRAALGRAILVGLAISVIILTAQYPILHMAFSLLQGSVEVEQITAGYFNIRVWGVPAMLTLYSFMGLLIGLGLSKTLLIVQLILNVLNVCLDIYFAGVLGWGARGIALGTLISEWVTLMVAGVMVWRILTGRYRGGSDFWPWGKIRDLSALRVTLVAQANIMIRTFSLLLGFSWFINQGAMFGDTLLAANHILLQFITFSAFFLDGYAHVAESLIGHAMGEKNYTKLLRAIKSTTILAAVTAFALAGGIALLGPLFIDLLTDIIEIREAAEYYLIYPVIYIVLSFGAYQLDGVFIGASLSRQMRNAACLSLVLFIIGWAILQPSFGIHGLWISFIVYVCVRALSLLFYRGDLRRACIGNLDCSLVDNDTKL